MLSPITVVILRDIDTELQLELSTSRTLASLMIPERYRHGMKN